MPVEGCLCHAGMAGVGHLGISMFCSEEVMTPGQSVALLDTALGSLCPLSFFDSIVTAFTAMGRRQDAAATAWVGCLYAEREIEVLMKLRAAWARGESASPREAARSVARGHNILGDELSQRWRGRE